MQQMLAKTYFANAIYVSGLWCLLLLCAIRPHLTFCPFTFSVVFSNKCSVLQLLLPAQIVKKQAQCVGRCACSALVCASELVCLRFVCIENEKDRSGVLSVLAVKFAAV